MASAHSDFLHGTTRLVREHGMITTEDLNVAGTTSSARGTVEEPGRNVRAGTGPNRPVLGAALGGDPAAD